MKRWSMVVIYALAMAWVEAAVVYYLRVLIDRINPYQPNPLPNFGGLGMAEAVREVATIVMLASVAILAGTNRRTRWSYFLIAFGVWDIFYYVFLKVMTGWPYSIWDWDILFLVPLPWWGPVLAPCLVAALMIVFGTLVSQYDNPTRRVWPRARAGFVALVGALLALYVFMADALHALNANAFNSGADPTRLMRDMLPTNFNWLLFFIALALMSAPVIDVAIQIWTQRRITAILLSLPFS